MCGSVFGGVFVKRRIIVYVYARARAVSSFCLYLCAHLSLCVENVNQEFQIFLSRTRKPGFKKFYKCEPRYVCDCRINNCKEWAVTP